MDCQCNTILDSLESIEEESRMLGSTTHWWLEINDALLLQEKYKYTNWSKAKSLFARLEAREVGGQLYP